MVLKHLKQLITWLLRIFVLLLMGFVAYLWNGLSMRALISFDRTGLDPGEPGFGLPIDYAGTLFCCLGPIGWIIGLVGFGLAFAMALVVYRWPWPLRVILTTAPTALVAYLTIYSWDLRPCVRSMSLPIIAAEMVIAALAAVLCRSMARRLWSVDR